MIKRVALNFTLLPIMAVLAYFFPVHFAYGMVAIQAFVSGLDLYRYIQWRSDLERASAEMLYRYVTRDES